MRTRGYVRVYENAISQDLIDGVMVGCNQNDIYNEVAVPDIMSFKSTPINYTPWMKLNQIINESYDFLEMYKSDVGYTHEDLFGQSYRTKMFFREFRPGDFKAEMPDVISDVNSNTFISAIYFLNDSDLTVSFHQNVGSENIKAKKGSLLLFPSNWMFPYSIKSSDHESTFMIAGRYEWVTPRN